MNNPLGREVRYSDCYDAGLLFAVPRAQGRAALSGTARAFLGADHWNCFELSWLSPSGKPDVAVAQISYSADSPAIVESKSLKLYLNSFAGTSVDGIEAVRQRITEDLSQLLTTSVSVRLVPAITFENTLQPSIEARSIDSVPVACSVFLPQPELLSTSTEQTSEILTSNLLRTRCPVTGQPDWATVVIQYRGPKIDAGSLVQYLVSFRNHQGFHESCTEQIYHDISERCAPEELAVLCLFSRRGGIEIHPLRISPGIDFQYNRLKTFRG